MSEFNIIDRYFANATPNREDVLLGIGDDAAVLRPADNQQLVVATDTLVAGVHFPARATAESIGHKALAVNLSDLAAMGATPAWALLALTLPTEQPQWLADFMAGFSRLAERFNVALVGGDTTRGPLTITVQVIGHVQPNRVLTRSGAKPGDGIFVTGSLGDAAMALHIDMQALTGAAADADAWLASLHERLDSPTPRIAAGQVLGPIATGAIDVSDGLVSDLGHLLTASAVGARLELDKIPRSTAFINLQRGVGIDKKTAWQLVLAGGEDYELCFTLPQTGTDSLQGASWPVDLAVTRVGTVTDKSGLELVDNSGQVVSLNDFGLTGGYDHFR